MHRCSWVNDDPLYIDYHDHEWGKPVYDDQKLYEMFLFRNISSRAFLDHYFYIKEKLLKRLLINLMLIK